MTTWVAILANGERFTFAIEDEDAAVAWDVAICHRNELFGDTPFTSISYVEPKT